MGKIYGVKPKVKVTEQAQVEKYQDIFNLVTRNGKTQVAIQNNILTKKEFDSVDDAKAYIDAKPWELLINVICLIYDMTKNMNINTEKTI